MVGAYRQNFNGKTVFKGPDARRRFLPLLLTSIMQQNNKKCITWKCSGASKFEEIAQKHVLLIWHSCNFAVLA
jgi:hypothetical protein